MVKTIEDSENYSPTIEDGEKNLCVVPESWEKNEILYWPPGRKGLNLRRYDSVLADFNNWSKKMHCKKKKFCYISSCY